MVRRRSFIKLPILTKLSFNIINFNFRFKRWKWFSTSIVNRKKLFFKKRQINLFILFKLLKMWTSFVVKTIKLISFIFFKHVNSQLNIHFNIYLFNKHLISLQNSLLIQKVLLNYRTLVITQRTALVLLTAKYTTFNQILSKKLHFNLLNLITIKPAWSVDSLVLSAKFSPKLNLLNYNLYDTTNLWLFHKCNFVIPSVNLFAGLFNYTLSLATTFYILNIYKILICIPD